MSDFKQSRYVHIASDEDIMPDRSILYATRTGVAVELNNLFIDAFKSQNWSLLPNNVLTELVRIEAIVPTDEDELATVLASNKSSVLDKDSKELAYTIQPSANCQLGCHYCGQSHVKKVMDDKTSELIFSRISERVSKLQSTLKLLSITWYGGEPLTGLASIRSLSPRLRKLASDNNLGYRGDIVTNGLNLKMDLFEELVSVHKITRYQITLDGTEFYHDKRRMLKNNNPSFNIIFNNIENIVKSDFYKHSNAEISIRCNVDDENKDNVYDLIELLRNKDLLKYINFYVSPVHDWGDNDASTINGITKEDFAQFEIDIMMRLLEYGVLRTGNLVPPRNTAPCMVVSETSEVLDAYGNVSTCWEVPYTPFYENTAFVTGNLHVDPNLSTQDSAMRHWFDEIPTNESWCKGCKFLPVCGGACPKDWYNGSPACPSFKFNIDERLFLKRMIAERRV